MSAMSDIPTPTERLFTKLRMKHFGEEVYIVGALDTANTILRWHPDAIVYEIGDDNTVYRRRKVLRRGVPQ